jgi:hypothetical protein
MHFHFDFSAVEILWTLTFAAELVLLVVLMGRERLRRFPWFSVSIAAAALRLLIARLLSGKLPQLTFAEIMITLADAIVVIGALVLVELARRAFRGAGRGGAIAVTLAVLAVGGCVLAFWGPWPAWKTLTAQSKVAVLQFMQLAARKGELLLDVLAVELGVLVVAFGRRYGAGWRSYAQRIVIGLSTAGLARLTVQAVLQSIAAHAVPKSRQEYERFVSLDDRIINANSAIYIAVVLWWIVCLWIDEPGAASPAGAGVTSAAAATVNQADEAAPVHGAENASAGPEGKAEPPADSGAEHASAPPAPKED